MVEITSLPVDILTMIMVIVATYANGANGARDLAWISATCKEFKKVAKQVSVLKLLNFRDSISTCTLDYRKHRHPKDILFLCARYGNQIAESSFGKGLLHGDHWCWLMTFINSNPARDENGSIVRGPLQHRRLVRSFIRHGSSKDISKIFFPLHIYMISNARFEEYHAHITFQAIFDMCFYENTISNILAITSGKAKCLVCAQNDLFLDGDMRPHSLAPREGVLILYDKIIPSTPF